MNWTRTGRRIFSILILTIQAFFLYEIFKENSNSLWIAGLVVLLCLLLITTSLGVRIHHKHHEYEHILVVIWIPVGAFSSFYLNHFLHLGPVISAAATGAAASFLPILNKRSRYMNQIPAAIYCGAFIGMSSTGVAPNFLFITTASFFTAILLLFSKNLFAGVGGKLGTLAFAGVAITSMLYFLISSYV